MYSMTGTSSPLIKKTKQLSRHTRNSISTKSWGGIQTSFKDFVKGKFYQTYVVSLAVEMTGGVASLSNFVLVTINSFFKMTYWVIETTQKQCKNVDKLSSVFEITTILQSLENPSCKSLAFFLSENERLDACKETKVSSYSGFMEPCRLTVEYRTAIVAAIARLSTASGLTRLTRRFIIEPYIILSLVFFRYVPSGFTCKSVPDKCRLLTFLQTMQN